VVAYAPGGEHLARYGGVIAGAPWDEADPLRQLADAGNATRAGVEVTRTLVDAGYDVDVVDVTRTPLDPTAVVVVPSLRILQAEAFDALTRHTVAGGTVVFAGEIPDHDDLLRPRDELTALAGPTLADLAELDLPRSARVDASGVDASCRTGHTARYLTVVNRSGRSWAGEVGLAAGAVLRVGCGHATVLWAALTPDGTVTAAMVDGAPGVVGDLVVDQGLAAVALLDGAWEVVTADRTDVVVPRAAGQPVWRVLLTGEVLAVGEVAPDGRFHAVVEDDAGTTDRYVLGPRDTAERAAASVTWFRETSWATAREDLATLSHTLTDDDPDLVELRDRLNSLDLEGLAASLARLRSRLAAGTGTPAVRTAESTLTRIAVRVRDLDLGAT